MSRFPDEFYDKATCDHVEDSGSDRKLGAVTYSVMFATYLVALTVLAILAVQPLYFFAVLLAGFPVSGVFLSSIIGIKERKKAIEEIEYRPEPTSREPLYVERSTNDDGLPVIRL